MIKIQPFRFMFIVYKLYFLTIVYAVNHNIDSPIRDELYSFNYKGIYLINDYGWFITQKQKEPIKQIELKGKWYSVKQYYLHEVYPFMIFKVDLDNNVQKDESLLLKYLANQKDIDDYCGWITKLIFVSGPRDTEGKMNENIQNCNKYLFEINKIKRQEGGYLYLELRAPLSTCYQEVWPKAKQFMKKLLLANDNQLDNCLLDPIYKTNYLDKFIDKKSILLNDLNGMQKIIHTLIDQKKKHEEDHLKSENFQFENNFNNLSEIKNYNDEIKLLQNKMILKQTELYKILFLNEIEFWEKHKKEIEAKQSKILCNVATIQSFPNSYLQANPDEQKSIAEIINYVMQGDCLNINYSGMILVRSNMLHLDNNNCYHYFKVAGITSAQESSDFIKEGENVIIDLTTPEIHEWILSTITFDDWVVNTIDINDWITSGSDVEDQENILKRKEFFNDLNINDPIKKVCVK